MGKEKVVVEWVGVVWCRDLDRAVVEKKSRRSNTFFYLFPIEFNHVHA